MGTHPSNTCTVALPACPGASCGTACANFQDSTNKCCNNDFPLCDMCARRPTGAARHTLPCTLPDAAIPSLHRMTVRRTISALAAHARHASLLATCARMTHSAATTRRASRRKPRSTAACACVAAWRSPWRMPHTICARALTAACIHCAAAFAPHATSSANRVPQALAATSAACSASGAPQRAGAVGCACVTRAHAV